MKSDLLHNKSAYGGRGWSQRRSSLREEAGRIWGHFGQSNEWAALKAVLLHRPGPELRTTQSPDTVQMLARLDVEKARFQHETLAQAYIQAGIKAFYENLGITCLTVEIDEIAKAAGAIGCLTGIIEREPMST